MTRLFTLGLIAGLALSVQTGRARTVRFDIDGQYRGGISLDFGKIGDTTLTFEKLRDGATRVSGIGRVQHPREKTKILEFQLDLTFSVEGNWIRNVASRSTSNENGKKLLEKIERILPFLHVASMIPASEHPVAKSYYTRQGVFGVTATTTGNAVEVALEDGPKLLARFYLRRGTDGLTSLERFRVLTKDGAVLNFIADRPLAFAAILRAER